MNLAALSLYLVSLLATGAPPESGTQRRASILVQVVEARKTRKTYVDPDVGERLRRQLTRAFKKRFNSFKLMKDVSFTLKPKHRESVALPGRKATLLVTYIGTQGNFLKLHLEVSGMRINVKVHNGGTFFHATPRKKRLLVIAVTSRVI